MIRIGALCLVLLLLAACGADGEPERPEPTTVGLSGTVRIGITQTL